MYAGSTEGSNSAIDPDTRVVKSHARDAAGRLFWEVLAAQEAA